MSSSVVPRVSGDEVRNQVLLLARLLREALEHLLEAIVGADARLHHLVEGTVLGVFRGNLEEPTHVVGDQLLHILGRTHGQVVAQPRADEHLLDAGDRPRLAVELDQGAVVGAEVLADAREDAGQAPARGLDLRVLAGHAVHVGGGAAQVGDGAGEAGRAVADLLDLLEDGGFRAALDDAPLVLGDGAEGAPRQSSRA
jgi:hypothetical protein